MWTSRRVANLAPNVFADANRRLEALRARGVEPINLGIGDPDLPTPGHIVRALNQASADPSSHRYPNHFGLPDLRRAIATWYRQRFAVELDPAREVLPLIGSKEGIAHAGLAFLDPGDLALVTEPCYPTYAAGTQLAGAEIGWLPLRSANGFLPDLKAIDEETAGRAKVLWLNYPNNPTGAVAPLDFFTEAVEFAHGHRILLLHDAAYTEVAFDGYRANSILEIEGARDVAVEFHSLSKTYNMPGWRIGMAVGNEEAIEALAQVKSQIDTGIFVAVQRAAVAALDGPREWQYDRNMVYQRRRDLVHGALSRMGVLAHVPRAGMFVWAETPGGSSAEWSLRLLEREAVFIPPGDAFGPSGRGFLRISLTVADALLVEAMVRLERFLGS